MKPSDYQALKAKIKAETKRGMEKAKTRLKALEKKRLEALDVVYAVSKESSKNASSETVIVPTRVIPATVQPELLVVRKPYGVLVHSVREAITALDKEFSLDDVFEIVRLQLPTVKKNSISGALARMVSKTIDIISAGAGQTQARYRKKIQMIKPPDVIEKLPMVTAKPPVVVVPPRRVFARPIARRVEGTEEVKE